MSPTSESLTDAINLKGTKQEPLNMSIVEGFDNNGIYERKNTWFLKGLILNIYRTEFVPLSRPR